MHAERALSAEFRQSIQGEQHRRVLALLAHHAEPVPARKRLYPSRRQPARRGLWHGAAWNFVLWGGLHGLYMVLHGQFPWKLPALAGRILTLLAVVTAWVPFRATGLDATRTMLRGMAGCNGIALPQMIVHAFPPLAVIATPVPLLPYLGDARTLSFPDVSACLLLGWTIVLALPTVHELSERARGWALTGGFAFTAQALFFAPHVTPFLYFQF
jgi:alginate O-acetyltransferase complex protein AlgI